MNEDFDPNKHERVQGGGFVMKEAAELTRRAEKEAENENWGRKIQAQDAATKANAKRTLMDKVLGRNKASAGYRSVSSIDVLESQAETPVLEKEAIVSVASEVAVPKTVGQESASDKANDNMEEIPGVKDPRRFVRAVSECLGDTDPTSRRGRIAEVQNQLNELARIFSVHEITGDKFHQGYHTVDELLSKLDPKKTPDFYGAVLRSFIFFGHSEDQNNWNHSVCHTFESSKWGNPSVFDLPDTGAATVVLEELANRASNRRNLGGCSPRILLPVVEYNMKNMSFDNLDGAFPLRPEAFTKEEFFGLISSDIKYIDLRALRILCTAKTPREFFIAAINQDVPLVPLTENDKKPAPGFMTTKARQNLIKIFDSIKDSVPSEVFDAYFKKYFKLQDQDLTIDQVLANTTLAEQATGLEKGLFVDVDGTLISSTGALDKRILDTINLADANGDSVVIFTGGDPERQTVLLRQLGIPEKFLPVRSKTDYRGKVLGLLIDDTPADMQGFRAGKSWNPSNSGTPNDTYEKARGKWKS